MAKTAVIEPSPSVLKAKLTKTTRNLDEARETISQLRAELDRVNDTNAGLFDSCHDRDGQIAELKAKIGDLEAAEAAAAAKAAAARAKPVVGKNACPTCGVSRGVADRAVELQVQNNRLNREYRQMAADLGVAKADARIAALAASDAQASLQRKVSRQKSAIKTLEAKLARRGESPYAEDAQ